MSEMSEGLQRDWNQHLKELLDERMKVIHDYTHTSASLQRSHDLIMKKAVSLALKRTEGEWGESPTHFTFFLMGSGARLEQAFWSDQDHGIIYEGESERHRDYFVLLGQNIVDALSQVGYEPCDGNVMASNRKWCMSLDEWKKQLTGWLKENRWESLRYTLTFFDSRVLTGEEKLLYELKGYLFSCIEEHPYLLKRFTENTGRLRKGTGLFNQLLVETKGKHQGLFDLKQIVLFPYVNGMRLLALKHQIYEPSTLERFEQLPEVHQAIKHKQKSYERLLEKRIEWTKNVQEYDRVHHLSLKDISAEDQKQLKEWVREGHRLYREIERAFKEGEWT
ncbi:DUF294 nucleotidyltransferase-like domain-containing protein [Halalkalibacter sp. AB-rgal2]|uniref:DUF294 nucleotidyltransferase-like domain-containing protein n=1 Tax=Halalkalibacter sp. AB-rgal2 TaxID=3242695 RepID=UPI00359ECAF3